MSSSSANGEQTDSYDEFLERIRTGRHPDFGEIVWDGEIQQISLSVKFDLGWMETDTAIRERAWRYLRGLSPTERAIVKIRIQVHNGLPVRAAISPREGAAGVLRLGTDRLQALEQELNS